MSFFVWPGLCVRSNLDQCFSGIKSSPVYKRWYVQTDKYFEDLRGHRPPAPGVVAHDLAVLDDEHAIGDVERRNSRPASENHDRQSALIRELRFRRAGHFPG